MVGPPAYHHAEGRRCLSTVPRPRGPHLPGHMKNLTGVLVFSAVLFLAPGCTRKTGEAPGPTDASAATDEAARTGASKGALSAEDAGSGSTTRAAQEACVDTWLQKQGLDAYGNPEGSMYAGGTPLFNERTGEQIDRLDFIFKNKPEARQACSGDASTE
ncbi:hypothetical protein BHS07_20690 [Myxococcus xanthus]|uniref:Uncharacterized protein n=2 Tax=Myxococcus xanthus TaxID=34 RepID=A0AAE6G1B6_MYXXA|nr:hypothetical protein BHS09_20025 [Myxococcus xanthus]QDE76355.1 hypothetical protein BHS08_20040 [Myxococcus xanthus]QDE83780.1 hypothetical protein BHS07_20690 [Myxococcus xanthus]QDE97908.1 hypothetical protein BHS05_19830 [Myxococcus xanthus]QDF05605.1 hypothetical protein BHS04_20705 [Myxococcus xanthus]